LLDGANHVSLTLVLRGVVLGDRGAVWIRHGDGELVGVGPRREVRGLLASGEAAGRGGMRDAHFGVRAAGAGGADGDRGDRGGGGGHDEGAQEVVLEVHDGFLSVGGFVSRRG